MLKRIQVMITEVLYSGIIVFKPLRRDDVKLFERLLDMDAMSRAFL